MKGLNKQVEALYEAQDEIQEEIDNIQILIRNNAILGILPEATPIFEKECAKLREEIKDIEDAIITLRTYCY